MLFIEYPKCTTCQKAKKWLDDHGITYTDRHIKENPPTYEELKAWHARSGLPLRRFFNTSGLVYKAIENKNRTLAVALAAVACPVVNTGVFLLGCLLFFMETISAWADAAGLGANVGQFMIVGLVGANFLFELLFNAVLSPVILRLIRIGKKEVE